MQCHGFSRQASGYSRHFVSPTTVSKPASAACPLQSNAKCVGTFLQASGRQHLTALQPQFRLESVAVAAEAAPPQSEQQGTPSTGVCPLNGRSVPVPTVVGATCRRCLAGLNVLKRIIFLGWHWRSTLDACENGLQPRLHAAWWTWRLTGRSAQLVQMACHLERMQAM
jgi:hypothetical protein